MQRKKFISATALSLLGLNRMFSRAPTSHEIIKKKRFQTIETKVLVVGGGSAGIGVAIGAAKKRKMKVYCSAQDGIDCPADVSGVNAKLICNV